MNPKEFLDFLIRRRSIRKYLEKPISDEDLNMILEAGRWAPSGTNRQPWKFIIIKNRELLQQIVKRRKDLGLPAGLPLRTAQLGIAIVGNIGEYPKIEFNLERIWSGEATEMEVKKEQCLMDSSLAAMNMMLMAWALNIGTCCIGFLDREHTKKLLGIDEQNYLLYILAVGHIKGNIPRPTKRKNLEEICRFIV